MSTKNLTFFLYQNVDVLYLRKISYMFTLHCHFINFQSSIVFFASSLLFVLSITLLMCCWVHFFYLDIRIGSMNYHNSFFVTSNQDNYNHDFQFLTQCNISYCTVVSHVPIYSKTRQSSYANFYFSMIFYYTQSQSYYLKRPLCQSTLLHN